MAAESSGVTERTLWRRRNDAERSVRSAIARQPGLKIFGVGMEGRPGSRGEFFVTLTATDESARRSAQQLLNGCSGLSSQDWTSGWRRLQLGDWMIRVYPERGRS